MNDAHWHLVVNHFPIIGTIFGLGILIAGLVLKNKTSINTAYLIFIVAAFFALASMSTGEGAEEMVEDMPSVGKQIIHEHEEMAEKLALVLYILGGFSIVGLILNIKNHSKAMLVTYLILIISVVAVFLGKETGTTGGEVRHTEIRANASANAITNEAGSESEHRTSLTRFCTARFTPPGRFQILNSNVLLKLDTGIRYSRWKPQQLLVPFVYSKATLIRVHASPSVWNLDT